MAATSHGNLSTFIHNSDFLELWKLNAVTRARHNDEFGGSRVDFSIVIIIIIIISIIIFPLCKLFAVGPELFGKTVVRFGQRAHAFTRYFVHVLYTDNARR